MAEMESAAGVADVTSKERVKQMKARLYCERSLHALTSTLALFAQRLPFVKNLCPIFSSPVSLGVATPITVSFIGTHSLSGQSVMIIPIEGFTNPADAELGQDFQWAFTTDRYTVKDVVIEGLPDGLTGGLVTGDPELSGIGQIVGKPTETGEFTVTIVAWKRLNQGGSSTAPYSLTINVAGPADPFAEWREENWNGVELDDLAISGPNADPDNDGLENLLEFVLDLDPKERSQIPGEFVVDPDDDSMFRYEIPLRADAEELNIGFQENSTLDPAQWTDVSEAGIIRTESKIVLSIPRAPGRKFYRLRVAL
jgi:hypothetical protein